MQFVPILRLFIFALLQIRPNEPLTIQLSNRKVSLVVPKVIVGNIQLLNTTFCQLLNPLQLLIVLVSISNITLKLSLGFLNLTTLSSEQLT